DLCRSFKEAINNATRHSRCRQVTSELQVSAPWLMLNVADDGVGFDLAGDNDGCGLENMTRRAKALGGELTIRSSINECTTIHLRAPFTRRRRPLGEESVSRPV